MDQNAVAFGGLADRSVGVHQRDGDLLHMPICLDHGSKSWAKRNTRSIKGTFLATERQRDFIESFFADRLAALDPFHCRNRHGGEVRERRDDCVCGECPTFTNLKILQTR